MTVFSYEYLSENSSNRGGRVPVRAEGKSRSFRIVSKPIAFLAALFAFGFTSAPQASAATGHSLFHSRQLWATIDVCTPKDQPNTLGIRGSMPSDGFASDTMYMRFRLQYQNPTTKQWIDDPAHGADSGFLTVGPASSARQNGLSFQLTPVPGKPAFTLRGVVSFQWRKGVHVLHSASRPTTAGHQSLAGADPAGFSAATCVIG